MGQAGQAFYLSDETPLNSAEPYESTEPDEPAESYEPTEFEEPNKSYKPTGSGPHNDTTLDHQVHCGSVTTPLS
jgi:hypothetical protein